MTTMRIAVLATMVSGLLLGSAATAEQRRLPKDKDFSVSAACSSECGKKHGNGKVKGQPYDRAGYEACMIECVRQANSGGRPERKN